MSDKIGEHDGFVGTGPNMIMPHFRKRHSLQIRRSRRDIILGILLAIGFLYLCYYIIGHYFYYQPPGM